MYSLFMDSKFYMNNKFLRTMKEMKRMSLFYSVNMYDLLLLVSCIRHLLMNIDHDLIRLSLFVCDWETTDLKYV